MDQGARYLTGKNPRVVQAEFPTLSWAIVVDSVGLNFFKFFSLPNDFMKYFGGHLAPSRHCSILIETLLANKA